MDVRRSSAEQARLGDGDRAASGVLTLTDTSTEAGESRPQPPSRRRFDVASWPPARRNGWLLAAVAVAFGVFVPVVVGLGYPYSTDEAIYLSQFNPDVPTYGWAAWRAWGMPVLGAPMAALDAPLWAVRLYFVVLASAGLFLAFRPWLRVSARPLAPVAAALFAGTAVVVFNGSLALPNLYSALAAVAATGYFVVCRRSAENRRRSLFGLAAAVALAALVRPSDSLWLVLPLGLAWLALRDWRRPGILVAVAAGQVAGWAPWIIESLYLFGGPFQRLHLSSAMLGGTHLYPDLAMAGLYVKLWNSGSVGAVSLDVPVPLRGGAATVATVQLPGASYLDLLWWAAAAFALAVGALGAVRARRTAEGATPFLAPLVVGLCVAFPYLFMMRYGQLRFVLPVIGLLVLPVAYGVLEVGMLRLPRARLAAPVLAVAIALGLAGVQLLAAVNNRTGMTSRTVSYTAVVERLRELGVTGDCAVAGEGRFHIAYELGCDALGSAPNNTEPAALVSARGRGQLVAVVLRTPPRPGTFLEGWRPFVAPIPGQSGTWSIYLSPA
ncbi:hypothetical protein [Catellatospora vulcania]|uniref:hypothetical protein n=1 Tax=Catellatospora vulcania TaxID=1460450 RepID=UPI0012D462A1|nr:hypothetical protein [Catellatospora vulcania]